MEVYLGWNRATRLPDAAWTEACGSNRDERKWYAVFTIPRNETSVTKHLAYLQIESFLPTYQVQRVWKNRHRTVGIHPLFPNYVFVHIFLDDRCRVLQVPGVVQMVGRARQPIPVAEAEIEFLRAGCCQRRLEPYPELAVGRKVRIRRGLMEGVEGTLIRKNNTWRFVLTLTLINQQAAVEVCADDLEPAN